MWAYGGSPLREETESWREEKDSFQPSGLVGLQLGGRGRVSFHTVLAKQRPEPSGPPHAMICIQNSGALVHRRFYVCSS